MPIFGSVILANLSLFETPAFHLLHLLLRMHRLYGVTVFVMVRMLFMPMRLSSVLLLQEPGIRQQNPLPFCDFNAQCPKHC